MAPKLVPKACPKNDPSIGAICTFALGCQNGTNKEGTKLAPFMDLWHPYMLAPIGAKLGTELPIYGHVYK